MREIKFRAWDNECGRMFFDLTISSIIAQTQELGSHWLSEADHVLEQYTGLKDKNGKEIYEGDIVKALNGQIGPVYYDDTKGGFYMDDYYDSSADNPSMVFEEGFPEVIGNIHETPELLNG